MQALGALVLLGALLARLARIQSPVFVPEHPFAPHTQLGRVTLRGRTLGYTVRCQGREVFAAPGSRPFQQVRVSPDGRWLHLVAPPRQARVRLADCSTEISPLPH